jgi:hypothetical protein
MTSRYQAAQRAVELVARLQDEGLTVNEIAAEMRRLNVSTRQGGNDPAADLCASVQDMVADFAKAMGRPPAEASALRTRAEAAEQRAEAAEAALAQAHADRALMTGLWLATVPLEVLLALLPADPGDRDRLADALDAVDLQASAGSHTAAGRAVIGRIVAAAGGAR